MYLDTFRAVLQGREAHIPTEHNPCVHDLSSSSSSSSFLIWTEFYLSCMMATLGLHLITWWRHCPRGMAGPLWWGSNTNSNTPSGNLGLRMEGLGDWYGSGCISWGLVMVVGCVHATASNYHLLVTGQFKLQQHDASTDHNMVRGLMIWLAFHRHIQRHTRQTSTTFLTCGWGKF